MSGTFGSQKWKIAWIFLLVAGVLMCEYLLVTRFFGLNADGQRRMAAFLGSVIVAWGSVCIVFFARFQADRRRKWRSILGPFGAIQVFAGLSTLFWALGQSRMAWVTTGLMLTCLLISSFLILPPRKHGPGEDSVSTPRSG